MSHKFLDHCILTDAHITQELVLYLYCGIKRVIECLSVRANGRFAIEFNRIRISGTQEKL